MTRPPSSDPAERILDELVRRAPRHAAPESLRRRLRLLVAGTARPPRLARWPAALAPALAAGIVLVAGGLLVARSGVAPAEGGLLSEAVHDHLRVLARQQPPEIASGGPHQVKPWFEGKLDFAPDVPAPTGGAVRLVGGSVGYVFDRKAAVLEYAVGGHAATLLVFRAEGLPWPRRAEGTEAGFRVVLWRAGDLGHALVSDLDARELSAVAAQLGAAPAGR